MRAASDASGRKTFALGIALLRTLVAFAPLLARVHYSVLTWTRFTLPRMTEFHVVEGLILCGLDIEDAAHME